MGPVTGLDGKFSDDYHKFVLQDPDYRMVPVANKNLKPFSLNPPDKSKKTKKDLEKEKQAKKQKPFT